MPAKRLFAAIDLPEPLRQALGQLTDASLRGVRWVRPEKMHVTLSFLGDAVPEEAQERLKLALPTVQLKPFFLAVAGLGSFGGNRPSVLWAGVGQGHPRLFALHKAIVDAVLSCGLEPDLQRFSAHVTLGRCGRETSGETVRQYLKRHGNFDGGQIKVEGFTLYSSRLMDAGSLYTPELKITWPN